MKKLLILSTLLLATLSALFIVLLNTVLDSQKIIGTYVPDVYQKSVTKYLAPQDTIKQQEKTISITSTRVEDLEHYIKELNAYSDTELKFKESKQDIRIGKMKDLILSNGMVMARYNLIDAFINGIVNVYPGSAYLDFHEDQLVLLSARGILAWTDDLKDDLSFTQIENNINDFIGLAQFKQHNSFSIKDLLISKGMVYVSFTEEIEPSCWNTSIIRGPYNPDKIEFEKFFSADNCIVADKSVHDFSAHASGGRMILFDNNHLLFTVGEYQTKYHAQDPKTVNGKIIKINLNSRDYEVVTMGHRNPQGLFYDRENNRILSTEHGPQGGDEINLINVEKVRSADLQNFGWAVSSAGEHYGGRVPKNAQRYKDFPLHKSHADYGFIEPLNSYVPSIGTSEIVKLQSSDYVHASLKDRSLYFFKLSEQAKIFDLERVHVDERIRDILVHDEKLYIFMETTDTIGIIDLTL